MSNLVLTRKKGERVVIGEAGTVLTASIVVLVDEVGGGKVRLVVQAERSVPVYRGEIQDRIDAQRAAGPVGNEAAPHEANVEPRRAG